MKKITDATMTKNHSITITGLKMGVIYYFRVLSRGIDGNLSTSKEYTFTIPTIISSTGENICKESWQVAMIQDTGYRIQDTGDKNLSYSGFIEGQQDIACCGRCWSWPECWPRCEDEKGNPLPSECCTPGMFWVRGEGILPGYSIDPGCDGCKEECRKKYAEDKKECDDLLVKCLALGLPPCAVAFLVPPLGVKCSIIMASACGSFHAICHLAKLIIFIQCLRDCDKEK